MKYTVYDASQFINVCETTDVIEALKARESFMDRNPASDCCIDADGKAFDSDYELEVFVDDLMDYPSAELVPMTVEEAEIDLAEHRKDGMDVPEQMTAEILAYLWNTLLEQNSKAAAADLQPDLPAEPDEHVKSLQTTMDYAWSRRNDEWNALENIRKNGPEFMLDKQYAEYRASQAFYEGICMAIVAAGYTIRIDDHETGKSTVCKQ